MKDEWVVTTVETTVSMAEKLVETMVSMAEKLVVMMVSMAEQLAARRDE